MLRPILLVIGVFGCYSWGGLAFLVVRWVAGDQRVDEDTVVGVEGGAEDVGLPGDGLGLL